ncbi:sugar phosphate isomerase/epimerase family protein [Brucellaceae bacterium D45D]
MTGYSYQLYSSRNFQPLERTFTMLRELGYASVEGFGGVYGDPAGLKRELDQRGLSMPTGHFGLDMLENETERALEIAATLQMKAIFCPYLVADQRPDSVTGWQEFGQRLLKAGAPFRDAGYEFGWHNHDFEFVPLADGSVPLTHILDASPDLKWEADIAWIIRGGGDPHAWIERYGEQIVAVHVKDIAISGEKLDEDGWEDVGHGTVNWPAFFSALRKTPARYFIMEHDNPSDDKRFASRSIAALRNF